MGRLYQYASVRKQEGADPPVAPVEAQHLLPGPLRLLDVYPGVVRAPPLRSLPRPAAVAAPRGLVHHNTVLGHGPPFVVFTVYRGRGSRRARFSANRLVP
jgi:hypothetical protein